MSSQHHKFEALVHAYSADLYRYAFWLCKDKAVAEDIVQETFLRAWKALDKLLDAKAAKAWLITIMRREMARHFKRNSLSEISIEDIEHIEEATGLDNEEATILQQAIAALPRQYREPLLLQVLGGYSSPEIAEILDIKPGAVMTRTFRARQKLRQMLGDTPTDLRLVSNKL